MDCFAELPELRVHLLKSLLSFDGENSVYPALPVADTVESLASLFSVCHYWYDFGRSEETTSILEDPRCCPIPAVCRQANERDKRVEKVLPYFRRVMKSTARLRGVYTETEDSRKLVTNARFFGLESKKVTMFVLYGEEEELFAAILARKQGNLHVYTSNSYKPPTRPWIASNFKFSNSPTPPAQDDIVILHPSFLRHSSEHISTIGNKAKQVILGLSASIILYINQERKKTETPVLTNILSFICANALPNGHYFVSRSYCDSVHPLAWCSPCSWGFYNNYQDSMFVRAFAPYLLFQELERDKLEKDSGKKFLNFYNFFVGGTLGLSSCCFVHPDHTFQ
jgi:hypothetical protein